MNIKWNISESDIKKVTDFVNQNKGPFVEKRIGLNIHRQNILIDKDSILKSMLMSILITQQRSDSFSSINIFLTQDPFPLTYSILSHEEHVEHYLRWILQKNNLNKYINKIPAFYSVNFSYLEDSKWLILSKIGELLDDQATKKDERDVADYIDQSFKGFGSMQARSFLQTLGLIKFEIPIDLTIANWLNDFGFPVTLSTTALQDKNYYHFVSDGIQILCEKANIYPCILDAAILSSFNNGHMSKNNIIY